MVPGQDPEEVRYQRGRVGEEERRETRGTTLQRIAPKRKARRRLRMQQRPHRAHNGHLNSPFNQRPFSILDTTGRTRPGRVEWFAVISRENEGRAMGLYRGLDHNSLASTCETRRQPRVNCWLQAQRRDQAQLRPTSLGEGIRRTRPRTPYGLQSRPLQTTSQGLAWG